MLTQEQATVQLKYGTATSSIAHTASRAVEEWSSESVSFPILKLVSVWYTEVIIQVTVLLHM